MLNVHTKKATRRSAFVMAIVMILSILTGFLSPLQAFAEESQQVNQTAERQARITYEIPSGDFDEWNIWFWNNGIVQDGQADLIKTTDTTATAYIPLSKTATKLGFLFRNGFDWADNPPKDGNDRNITLNTQDPLTKISVTQGSTDTFVVPSIPAPALNGESATIFYRDKDLYLTDEMHTIESATLLINDEEIPMTYETKNERFNATFDALPNGTYDYEFRVTLNGETATIADPYHTESTITFADYDMQITGTTAPNAIDYNQNAVLTVDITNPENGAIRSISADTTALGGPADLEIDPEIGAITVAVASNVTPGEKTIPLTLTDAYGKTHLGETTLTVLAREKTNAPDDFDWDEAVIYFMLTDRFANGDPSNDDPHGLNYDEVPAEYQRGTPQGGDFKGITENIDYLKELGINTIWITPVVDNIRHDARALESHATLQEHPYFGYHGYWANDFTELNPHLGDMSDYHEMIDTAAENGIKIMVDVVLNHSGYGLKRGDANVSNPPAQYPTSEERAVFDSMLRHDGGEGGDIRGELAGLPDFITEDPDVRQQIVDWQVDWIEKSTTAKGNSIDYFRVDTVKHVEDATWQVFKNELTNEMPEFKMIGEWFGAGTGNFAGHLSTGMMDSLLDFSFKGIARQFVDGNLEAANRTLTNRNATIDNTATLGQFLSSHDEAGFLHTLGGDRGKFKVAASLQLTAKGQPVIYYGEELGQTGDNNYPLYDNRYDLAWDDVENNDMLDHYQKVLNFRSDHSTTFARGNRVTVAGSNADKYLLVERAYGDDSVYIGLSTANEPTTVTLDVDSADVVVTDAYTGSVFEATEEQTVTLTIPAKADGGTVLLTAAGGEILSGETSEPPVTEDIPDNTLRVHLERSDNVFDQLGLWTWNDVVSPSGAWPTDAVLFENETDFGRYVDIPIKKDAKRIGMLINNRNGDNVSGDIVFDLLTPEMNEVWITAEDELFFYEPVDLPDNVLRIHYTRAANDYEPWGVWNWGDVVAPSDGWPHGALPFSNEQVGRYGGYVDLELTADPESVGFLLVNRDNGDQTGNMSFNQLDQHRQIFIKEGVDIAFTNPYFVTQEGMRSAEIVAEDTIDLRFSATSGVDVERLVDEIEVVDRNDKEVDVESATIKDDKLVAITINDLDVEAAPYTITYDSRTVTASASWRYKDALYSYDGELGASLHGDGTATLKLWSPSADNVSAVLYDKDDQDTEVATVEMTRGDKGVWQVTLEEGNTNVSDHTGYYYHYAIERGDETVLALDPYAKSMATWLGEREDETSVGKAAIVDPSAIGPELDFADIDGFEKREDAIIYEVHVRDFTSDPNIAEDLEAQFGTFASFVERLDYIEDLGVTHVQLLPVMSYYFADEFNSDVRMLDYESTNTNYNWGYDPHSYFSLSGMYSENPDDAAKRIEEFKNLIDEIHERGMGVVLDVVYNHTARVHIFEDLEPNYYHFMNADGTPRTSFGGGRLGTTHDMARRILVDSITYWVDEFKVDGFRFDMMGDHDAESIQLAYDEAKALNPNIVMIGEGWVTYAGDENDPDVQPADQQWMQDTESVGSFSDEFRNELKSGFGSEGQPRFLTNGARNIQTIYNNLTANPGNFKATNPGDVVPYIAAHDNLTLHDVIAQSIKKDPEFHQEEIHKRIRLGNTMVLTAQGTAFLHAGQEFGRTKQFRAPTDEAPYKSTYMEDAEGNPFTYPYFIHDSYDSSDIINRIDWKRATDKEAYPINTTTRAYTKGLIELRRSTDAFTRGTMEEIANNVSLIDAPEINDTDLVIGYRAKDSKGATYHVFVNADDEKRTVSTGVNLRRGDVLVDGKQAGTTRIANPSGFTLNATQIEIEPLTAVVIKTPGQSGGGGTTPPTNPVDPVDPVDPEEPVDPVDPEVPGETVIVENPQPDASGNIKVSVGNDTKQVLLPATAGAVNAQNKVVVESNNFVLELPGAVLAALKALAQGDESAQISIEFEAVDPSDRTLGDNAASVAGDMYNFTLSIVTADGEKRVLSSFDEPVQLSLRIADNADPNLLGIYRIEADGEITYVGGRVANGMITTSLTSFSTYAVLSYDKSYSDVPSDYWAHDTIKRLSARHVINGYENNTFAPRRDVTRAEFTAMVARALSLGSTTSEVSFTDVPQNAWYASELAAAVDAGIVTGHTASQFAPNDVITREQMTAIIVRAYAHSGGEINSSAELDFADVSAVSTWARDYVAAAQAAGLVQGRGNGSFAPRGHANRAESAQMLYNLIW